MIKKLIQRRSPQTLARLFVYGSLAILLICLCATSFIFSVNFLKKEEQRSAVSMSQLEDSFEYEHRSMSEEMWTKNYPAIAGRILEISKQFGNAAFDFELTDRDLKCVYSTISPNKRDCTVSSMANLAVKELQKDSDLDKVLKFETSLNRYIYAVPMYTGRTHHGYLYVSMDDPYEFFRGKALTLATKVFLPIGACFILIWGLWLLISKHWILKPYLDRLVELKKKEALGLLAAQVAHDIQSPLAALSNVVQNSKGLETNQNQLLRSASSRIQSLADDLLTRYRDPDAAEKIQFTLVSAVIHSILAEKLAALDVKSTLRLNCHISEEALSIGVPLSSVTLSRILSNLLNNSIQALEGNPQGVVDVSSHVIGSLVEITIRDNGSGMSPDILEKVRTVGGSYGKTSGSGIGLSYAKEVVSRVGGTLSIDSTLNHGTTITIKVPASLAPSWCRAEIEFQSNQKVVVLDDDPTMHLLWKERLVGFPVTYLKSPEEFDIALFPPSSFRFIFDYEMEGSQKTGLDLIREHKLASAATLVTSYFNDPKIQLEIANLGSKMLPKFLVPSVPIHIEQEAPLFEKVDLILLDDDPVMHRLWKSQAKRFEKILLAFFQENGVPWDKIPRTTPIYIDYNLAGGVSGVDVALRLNDLGFENLYITTGSNVKEIDAPVLKGVIGKEFPKLQVVLEV